MLPKLNHIQSPNNQMKNFTFSIHKQIIYNVITLQQKKPQFVRFNQPKKQEGQCLIEVTIMTL